MFIAARLEKPLQVTQQKGLDNIADKKQRSFNQMKG